MDELHPRGLHVAGTDDIVTKKERDPKTGEPINEAPDQEKTPDEGADQPNENVETPKDDVSEDNPQTNEGGDTGEETGEEPA